jgi:hypothetical protein
VVSKQTYEPLMVIGGDGKVSKSLFYETHSTFYDVVCNHSIWPEKIDYRVGFAPISDTEEIVDIKSGVTITTRTESYQDDFFIPELYPKFINDIKKKVNKKRKLSSNSSSLSKSNQKVPEKAYLKLEKYINNIVHDQKLWFKDVFVSNISLSPTGKNARIDIDGKGSQLCMYVGRNHGSNRIYFLLSSKGTLTVKCYSKKNECCSKPPWFTFSVSNNITNDIFGKQSPPSLYVKRFKTRAKNQSNDSFGITSNTNTKQSHPEKEEFDYRNFIRKRINISTSNRKKHSKQLKNKSYIKQLKETIDKYK